MESNQWTDKNAENLEDRPGMGDHKTLKKDAKKRVGKRDFNSTVTLSAVRDRAYSARAQELSAGRLPWT